MILISVGFVIMLMATRIYHRIFRDSRDDAYPDQNGRKRIQTLSLVLMYIFLAGFLVGLMDVLLRPVEPIYMFVALIFLLGAFFIYTGVNTQERMMQTLRNKSKETMRTLVKVVDMKDAYTKGHSQHVYEIVSLLYDTLPEAYQCQIRKAMLLDAAMLHDIGKVGIGDEILNKAGKLTPEEWDIIKMHPAKGKEMLDGTNFRPVSEWVLKHHERMDGNGYYGLPREDIPLESRIIAVADTYSALCTDRVYRVKMRHSQAVEVMRQAVEEGQLDSALVEAFLRVDENRLQALLH